MPNEAAVRLSEDVLVLEKGVHLVELYFDEDRQSWEVFNHTPGWNLLQDSERVLRLARPLLPKRPRHRWASALLAVTDDGVELQATGDGNRPLLGD